MMLSWIVYRQILEGKMVICYLIHSQLYYQKNQHCCEVLSVTGNFAKGEGDSVVKSMYGLVWYQKYGFSSLWM